MSRPAGWLRAGTVGRPHGLDGSFHVNHATPALLNVETSVMVRDQERQITRRAGTDKRPIVRLHGCEDRACASALRGEEMLAPRADAPELGPDEWWAEDLEGCTVHDAHVPVGTVKRLLALPSCEVLEVGRGAGRPDLLVPLVSDAVREVDLRCREIEIDLRFLGES